MAAVALAWLHDRPAVSSVILGARTTEQLTANLAAAGLHLSPEEIAAPRRGQRPGAGGLPLRPGRAGAAGAQPVTCADSATSPPGW